MSGGIGGKSTKPALFSARAFAFSGLVILSNAALAGPEGGQIVGGAGSIEQSGALTQVIQSSQSLAINWDSFNVGAAEVVQFVQPGAQAVALNRIIGGSASEIFGRIDANGTVFLINTAGVLFAETAQINVANLMISGLDMSAEDFMNGNYALAANGLPGAVVNRGVIAAATGGSVTLVGGQVVNTGLIKAEYGRVTLAGAEAGYIDFDGDGLMRFEVTGELKQKLDGADAAVSNSGAIQSGEVIMEAAAARGVFDTLVNNEGIITATAIDTSGGQIRLVAVGGDAVNTGTLDASSVTGKGGSVTMTADGGDVVNAGLIDVSSRAGQAGTVTLAAVDGKVVNTGTIEATSEQAGAGVIQLAAAGGNVESSGDLLATSVAGAGGTILMESNADTLVTAGLVDVGSLESVGGTIHILGNRVAVMGPTRLGSSGGLGGGTILIGGDFRGANPLVRNALQTYVGPDVVINADVLQSGTAGRVIVWSEDVTRFFGTVSARGPPTGTGGFVEVSSHGLLVYQGFVDLRAGRVGTLLLDPTDIRICSDGVGGACEGAATELDFAGGIFSDADDNGPTPSILLVSDLVAQLNAANVTVTTASGHTDAGNITVEDPVSWLSANSLTLLADGSITVSAGLTATGSGSLILTAGTGIAVNAGISLNGGSFTATSASFTTGGSGTIATGAGAVSITTDTIALGAAISGTGPVLLQPLTLTRTVGLGAGAGDFQLDATELGFIGNGHSAITIGRADGTGAVTIDTATFVDPVTIVSGGAISVTGTLSGTGNASITLTGTAGTTLGADVTTEGDAITVNDAVTLAAATVLLTTTQNAQAAGAAIAVNGTVTGGGNSLAFDGGTGGAVSVTGAVAGVDDLTITNSNGATFGDTVTATDIVLTDTTDGQTIAFNGAVTATTLTTAAEGYGVALNAGGAFTNAVTFLNTGTTTLGDDAGDSLSFDGGVTATAGPVRLAGTVATTDDPIALGAVTLLGNARLWSAAGDITVASVTDGASNFTLTLQDSGATGDVTFTGNVTIDDLVTVAEAYGVTLEGAANTFDSEVTFVNTGTTTLGNDSTDVSTFDGGVTATAGPVNLAGTVATTDDALTLGAVTLTGHATLTSGAGAIEVASVTGGFDLTLQDNTAGSTGGVTFTGNVTIDDLVTFAQNYAVTLQGAANTFATQVAFLNTGTTTLGNEAGDSTTFDGGVTATAGAVSLAGAIVTSNDALTLGAVTLTADAALRSGSGTIQVASITDGASDFSLDLGDGSQTGAVTFTGNVTISDLDTFASAYAIAFQGTANVIDTATTFLNTGTTTFGNGAGDSITFTGGLTASAGAVSVAGAVATANADLTLGTATLTADTTLNAGTGTVTLAGVTAGANAFTITADEIDLTGSANSITGTGAITLQPFTAAQAVNIAGANSGLTTTLDLLTTDLEDLADGFSSITIGSSTATGLVTVATVAFMDPVTIRAGGATGDITIGGALTTTGGAGITVSAGRHVLVSGSIATGAETSGSNRTSGAISIAAGGDVTLNGAISTGALTLSDLNVSVGNALTSGSIDITAGGSLTGNASGTVQTGAVLVDGTGPDTATSGSIMLSAGGAIQLAATNALRTGNAAVDTTLGSNDPATSGSIMITTADRIAADGASTPLSIMVGTASGGSSNTAGSFAATTDGGAGDAGGIFVTSSAALTAGVLATAAGSSQNVTITGVGITLTDVVHIVTNDVITLDAGTGTLTIANTNNDLNVGSGDLSLRGDEINLTGGSNSIIGTGTVTLSAGQAGTPVVIAGTPAGGQLDLTATELAALADGFSLITIGRDDSTAALTVSGAVTFSDHLSLIGGSVSFGSTLTGGTGLSITIEAVAGSITSTSGTTRNLNLFPTVSLIATGSIGGADTFEAHAVTNLSLDAGASFAVEGDGSTLLTDLTLRVNPADAADTWVLSAFSGLTLASGDLTDTGANVLVDGIVWAPSGTNPLNITIIAVTGNILLEDQQGAGEVAINLGTDGGNITLTTLGAGADIFDNATATADDPADTNFANLITTATSTVTFNAEGDVGASGNGDIDVNGTGNIVCNSGTSTCHISTNVTLTGVSLTVDPVNDVVDINVTSGALSYIINETCLDANTCIILFERGDGDPNTMDAVADFDFSLTSNTGDIYIAENAIFDIGAGDVTLTATLGGIYEITSGTVTEISTTGLITLNAATGIGTQHLSAPTGGSVVVAAAPVDLAGTTLGASATTGAIRLNELDTITLETITAAAGAVFLSAAELLDDGAATAVSGTSVNLTTTGAIGAPGNEIDTTTAELVLDAGTTFNVANTSDLAVLAVTAGAGIGATSDVTATNLTFNVTSDGTDTTLANVSDTTGLDFSYTLLAGDMIVNTIDAGTGAVTLVANAVAGQEILDDEAGAASTTRIVGGAVTLTADAGVGTAADDIDTEATTLTASVTSGGPINVNELDGLDELGLDAGTGDITLVAGGSVLSADVAEDLVGNAVSVTLSAGDFGATDTNPGFAIETDAATLSVSTAAGGNQFILETDGLTDLDLDAGTGTIAFAAGGTVDQAAGSIVADSLVLLGAAAVYVLDSATNDVATLAADTGALTYWDANDLTVGTVGGTIGVTSTGAVELVSLGTFLLTVSDAITAIDQSVALYADSMDLAAAVDAGTGTVLLAPNTTLRPIELGTVGEAVAALALSDAELDQVTASALTIGNDGAGDLSVTAAIDLTDATAIPSLFLVTGGDVIGGLANVVTVDALSVTADGAGGIGNGGTDPLATSVDSLTTDTSVGGGSQFIVEANGLDDLDLNAGAGGIALVVTAGSVGDLSGDGTDVSGASFILTLDDATAQDVGASGAGNQVELAVDDLTVDTSAGNGSQYLSELDDLDDLDLDAGTGTIELTAGGAIEDSTGGDGTDTDVAGGTITLVAGSGIGSLLTLELAANYISADSTSGDIDLYNFSVGDDTNPDAPPSPDPVPVVEVISLTTDSGSITFSQVGGASLVVDFAETTTFGDITITRDDAGQPDGGMALLTVNAADNVVAELTGTDGGMLVDNVTAGNSISLISLGDIGENDYIAGGTPDGAADLTAPTLTMVAPGGVGQSDNILEIAVDDLTVDTSGAGGADQYLAETNGLADLDLNAGTGAIDLALMAGGIADAAADGTDITAVSVTLTLLDGTAQDIGSAGAGNQVETSVDTLIVDTSAGGGSQYLAEAAGLTDLDLNAGAGNVELTVVAGNVTDPDGNADIVASALTVVLQDVTAQDFGSSTLTNYIRTDVDTISVDTSAGGGTQYIFELDGGWSELFLDAGTGDVSLRVVGSILSGDVGVDVVANELFIGGAGGAGGSFGSVDTSAGNALETSVDILRIDASVADRDIFIRESDGLSEIGLFAAAGSINLYAGGSVLSADAATDISTTGSVNVTVASGSFGDTDTAAGNAIETAVADLSVDTSAGGGSQFIRELNGLSELSLNAGAGNVSLLSVSGSILSDDVAVDVIAASASLTANGAGAQVGDTDITAGNAIETSVDSLTVSSALDSFLRESNGLTDLSLNSGFGAVNLYLVAGSVFDTSADAIDVAGAAIAIYTPAGAIGASGNPIELFGVSDLTLAVQAGFFVAGDTITSLTDLDVTIDSSQPTSGVGSYVLTGFPNVADWGSVRGLYDETGGVGDVAIYGITSSATVNLSITNLSGDIYLTDLVDTGAAAVSLAGGNLTITAANGGIFDWCPTICGSSTDDTPATGYNLRTDSLSTVSLNAPGNTVGLPGDGDIDVNGTGNLAVNAETSYVATNVPLTSLDLTFDPVNDTVSFSLSGATIVTINETCVGADNLCIHSVSNSNSDLDFSVTAISGDIFLDQFAIHGIGAGDVSLTATNGGIFGVAGTDAHIATNGTVALSAGTGITFPSDSIGTAATPLDLMYEILTGTGAVPTPCAPGVACAFGTYDPVNFTLTRTNDGNIWISNSFDFVELQLDGFTSTGLGTTTITARSNNTAYALVINADVIQAGDILLTALSGGTLIDSISLEPGFTIRSTAGNVTLAAEDDVILGAGSVVETQGAAGTVLLSAGVGDVDGQGLVDIGDSATVTSAATGADAITLRAFDVTLGTGSAVAATGAGGGIRLFTTSGTTSIEVGGYCIFFGTPYCIDSTEASSLTDFDVLTVGEAGVQVADVTFVTFTPVPADGAVVANGGYIYLDDEATSAAILSGSGAITLNATWDILPVDTLAFSVRSADGIAELSTAGSITLSGVAVGLVGAPLEFAAGQDDVNITSATSGAVLAGLGDLTLGAIATGGGSLTVTLPASFTLTAAGTVATGTGAIDLQADEIDLTGGAGSVSGSGTVTLQPVTTSLAIDIGSTADVGGSLSITDGDIAALADGFSLLRIGSSSGSHVITVVDAAFTDPVTLRAPLLGGAIVDDAADSTTDLTAPALVISVGSGGVGQGLGGSLDVDVDTLNVTSAGAVSIEEANDVAVGLISAAGQAVTLVAGSEITDGNGGSVNVSASLLDVTAVDGISLDTSIVTLAASNMTAGGIDIADTDGMVIDAVSAPGQTVTLNGGTGGLNDNAADLVTDITAAAVVLTAGTGIGSALDLELAVDAVTATSGSNGIVLTNVDASGTTSANLTVLTSGSISYFQIGGAAVDITASTPAGAMSLNNAGDLTVTSAVAGSAVADNSDIAITTTAGGNVLVALVDSTGDDVIITSAGSINETADDLGADLLGATYDLDAVSGIGNTSPLELAGGGTLNVNNSTSNAVELAVLGSVDLTGTNGNAALNEPFTLNVIGSSTQNHLGTGAGLLSTNGGLLTLTLSDTSAASYCCVELRVEAGGLAANGGDITLRSGDDILVTGAIDAAGGTLTATADDAALETFADITGFVTDNGTGADVTADTADLDGGDGIFLSDLRAANISADTAIGSIAITNTLAGPVTVTSLSVASGAGSIGFAQAGGGAVTFASVSAVTGNVGLSNTGADLTATAVTTGGTGDVSLSTITSGDLIVDVVTAGDNVSLASAGAIVDGNADGTTNVTATSLDATAVAGIDLDTAIVLLNGVSAGGTVDIADADGLAVNTVSAAGQIVNLAAGGAGAITDGNADGTTNVTAAVLNATAGAGVNLDTDITTLGAVTAGGTVDIADVDDLAVDTVNAAGQVVNLAAGGSGAITDGNADGTVNVTAATLNATAGGGVDLDTDITTLNSVSAGGTVDIADVDSIAVNTIIAAGQTVNLTAAGAGAITDGNADGTMNVTASLLVATADTGITLDTAIAFLTASNTTSGGVDIADTDGFAVNTVSAPGQTVTLNGGTGAITDNNGDLVSNVGAATLSAVAALGIDLDTTVDSINGSTTGAGNVRFDETDGITVTSFTTANGAFTLTSDGATTLTSIVSTTSNDANDITVTAATGDLAVGTVNAGGAGGDVTLEATTGAITNSTSAVTGDVVTLTAQGGIGASGSRITTTAATLAATTTGAGAIWLNETDGAALSATAADGLIDIVTGGTTLLSSIVSSTDSDANDITILATSGDILVGFVDTDVADDGALGDVTITAAAGSINDHAADLLLDVRGDVLTLDGATGVGSTAELELDGNTLDIDGGTGGIGINDLNGGDVVLALTSGGNISYGTGGNIFVDQVIAGGTVTLTSFGGSINDHADDLVTDIVGTTVTLNAFHEIGGNALNVLVPVLDPFEALEIESSSLDLSAGVNLSTLASFAGVAGIVVRDIGGTTLADLDTVNGDITVLSDATLAVLDIHAGTTTLSDVVLDAATGIADAGAGDVVADLLTVDAGGPITLSTDVNSLDVATSAAGAITLTEVDDVTLTSISANSGAVSVTAGGSIAVTSVSAAGQTVTLDAGNAITDTNGATTNVTAAALNATAVAGIDLDTDIATLNGVSAGGTVDIADVDDLAVNTVSAPGQTVNLTAGGAGAITDGNADGTLNITAATLNATAGGGVDLDTAITTLDSVTAGGTVDIADVDSLAVNTIMAAGQLVNLTADGAGAITDGNADGTTNVTAATLNVTADAGIVLDTAIDVLTASNASSGGIDIADTDGFAVDTVSAPGQAVTLNAGTGAIDDDAADGLVDITAATVNLFAATGIGATSDLETAAGAINAVNGAGDIDLNNDLAAGDVGIDLVTTAGDIRFDQAGGASVFVTNAVTNTSGDIAITATDPTGGIGAFFIDSAGAVTVTTINSGEIIVREIVAATTATLTAATTINEDYLFPTAGASIDPDIDITAATIALVAGAGIGDIEALELSATTIGADTTNGNVVLNSIATGPVTASSLSTGTGSIVFSQTGGQTLTVTSATTAAGPIAITNTGDDLTAVSVSAGGLGDVALETITSGDLVVGAVSTPNSAILTAAGAITDGNGATTNVTANLLDASATTGISLDTAVAIVTADNLTSGGIDIADADGFAADAITALGQAVTLDGGAGAITDNNGATTNVSADQLTVTATAIDLDTAIATLTFNSAGAVVIGELDDVALSGASTADSLVLTAGGAITDGTDGDLAVTNNATLSGTAITLGNDAGNDTDFGTLTFSGAQVSIAEDSDTVLAGLSTATDTLALTSAGTITDGTDGDLAVTNNATLSGTAITLGNDAGNDTNFGTLTFNGAQVAIAEDSDTVLAGLSTATDTLALTSAGTITDGTDGDLAVTNNATLSGTAITLGNDAGNDTNFGTLTFTGAQVSIAEDSDTVLAGLSTATDTLTLTSAGTITDGTDGDLAVTNNATLSGTAITLGNDAGNDTNFGTLTFTGAQVSIAEDSDTVLAGLSTATDTLTLTSAGTITDGTDGDLAVTNNATLSGTAITLGNDAGNNTNFGTLTFTGAQVSIAEDSDTVLAGLSTATDTLALTSSGTITDGTDGDLAVTNNATLSGTAITLGNDAGNDTNFGTLTFTGAQVSIAEDSDTVLAGLSTATDTLTLTSSGTITDGTDGDLAVTNNATFNGTAITLGDDAGNDTDFGTLTFNSGGAVHIAEDSDTVLANSSTANTLVLESAGTITDGTDGDLAVTNNASFLATGITLGDNGATNGTTFGSLTFDSSGAVSIAEDDATHFFGPSSADSLSLTSAGPVTQAAGSSLTITNATTLTATGNTITLDQANDFNSVSILSATTVVLNDITGLVLGNVSVNNLTATAALALTDAGDLQLSGAAAFSGASIDLGGAGENTTFNTVQFNSTGAVSIQEDTSLTLAGASTAGSLTLVAPGIDDGAGTLNVTGATTLTATGANIALDNGHQFGSVAVTDAVNVALTDVDAIVIGPITTTTAGDLTVIAGGDITSGGALVITGDSVFTANGAGPYSVTVDDAGNDFTGTVTFNGTGLTDVTVVDTTDIDLAGADLAGSLSVTANGITASGALLVDGTSTFAAGTTSNLVLAAANDFGTVVIVSANDVTLNDVDGVDLGDVDVSGNLAVTADSVTSSGVAMVAGTTSITTDNGGVTLGNANDFTGAVTIDAAGDILLADVNNLAVALIDGVSVTLDAGGIITDADGDGGTPVARAAGNDIVYTGVLTVSADAFGDSADPLEIAGPNDGMADFTINGGGLFADFANDVSFSTLTVMGAGNATIVANTITVDADFDTGVTTDVELVARGKIVGGGGTITAGTLLLDALNLVAFGGSGDSSDAVIGAIDNPILLDMASGADYRVPGTAAYRAPGETLNGFGFINATNFTGSDFQRIFNDSNKRIFVIANFTDLIASVQGSFITAQIFTIDSSQFRADLNIFGVEGAGVLLPYDQCEDEESADCAKQ